MLTLPTPTLVPSPPPDPAPRPRQGKSFEELRYEDYAKGNKV